MFSPAFTDALPRMQARAEALMVDACTISRIAFPGDVGDDGRPIVDEALKYAGACKVATYEPHEQIRESAGTTQVIQRYSVHVPTDAGPFEVGDVVRITASAGLPSTLGRTFRIEGLLEKTWQTAQRLLVDEHPGMWLPDGESQ